MWRTSPPFGLQKSAAIASRPEAQSREYRTNEKISRGNSVATGLAQERGFKTHDSYAILAPMWDRPCDTHHYLCPNLSAVYGGGPGPGITDLQVFLYVHGGCPDG